MSNFLNNWLSLRAMSAPQGSTSKYIQFADPEVERICVANWSSDGIGLTMEDAAAVTSLGYAFNQNANIVSFNELRLFTGLTTIFSGSGTLLNAVFSRCAKLSEITIPDTITSFGSYSFNECAALTTMTCLSVNPPAFGTDMFRRANALEHIYVPAGSVNDYKAASGWSNYASIIEAIPSN